MKERYSQNRVLAILSDGEPRCSSEIAKLASLSRGAAENALRRLWERLLIQRTKYPLYKNERIFKGHGGVSRNTRPYHMYVLSPNNLNSIHLRNSEFVYFDRAYLDVRGGGVRSKAKIILAARTTATAIPIVKNSSGGFAGCLIGWLATCRATGAPHFGQ